MHLDNRLAFHDVIMRVVSCRFRYSDSISDESCSIFHHFSPLASYRTPLFLFEIFLFPWNFPGTSSDSWNWDRTNRFLPLGKTRGIVITFYIPTTPLPRGCAVPTTALVSICAYYTLSQLKLAVLFVFIHPHFCVVKLNYGILVAPFRFGLLW